MYNYKFPQSPRTGCKQQRGVSLIELMVGVAIGLVIIGAALATMLLSRTTAGTVSDASQLQQQVSYALFILGDRISSTGSLRFDKVAAASEYYVFDNTTSSRYLGAAGGGAKISGTNGAGVSSDTLVTSTQPQVGGENRDCLGAALPATATRNDAIFSVASGALLCTPNHGAANLTPQQIITNVEEFKVRYGVRAANGIGMQFFTANQIGTGSRATWNRVALVEVCLHLRGEENNQPVIAGTTYMDCNGNSKNRDGYLRHITTRAFYTSNTGL